MTPWGPPLAPLSQTPIHKPPGSTMSTKFFATFGFTRLRGGTQITEQAFIEAETEELAWQIADRMCHRGERVLDVRLTNW